jgi:hypothetical protein
MSEVEDAKPPLLPQASASPAAWQTGCFIAFGLALLPLLYAGSFAYLTFDAWNHWGFMDTLDPATHKALERFYWPLIEICEQFVKIVSRR